MKMLIIDRTMLIQESDTRSLLDSGIEIIITHSGEQTLHSLSEQTVDSIFLLFDADAIDDFELYKMLKQHAHFQRIPVVLLSTQNRAGLIQHIVTCTSRHISNNPAENLSMSSEGTAVNANTTTLPDNTIEQHLRRFVHDYNNTFGIINGYADLLSPLLEKASDKHTFTEKIIQASKDGLALTDRLLDFASGRIEK